MLLEATGEKRLRAAEEIEKFKSEIKSAKKKRKMEK